LTGENKPCPGGNEKPLLISRFSSRLHRFLLCLSLALATRQHFPGPSVDLTLMQKDPATMAAGSLIAFVLS
jgi:hypothetical protein